MTLPDELAQSAEQAGLLSSQAIQRLPEEAVRRQAGRKLLDIAKRVHAADIPPMSMQEINAEVKVVRVERRAQQAKDDDAGRT